jgi:hypothetical protein
MFSVTQNVGIRTYVGFSFSTTDSSLMSNFTLVRSEVEYALTVRNITTIEANQMERVQRKFADLCFTRFFLTSLTIMVVHLGC